MAISNATRLSDFGSGIGTQGAVLSVNNTNSTIGLGTTNPQRMVQVGQNMTLDDSGINLTGVVTATSFAWGGNNQTAYGSGIYAVGVITATSFSGSGVNLTGVSGFGTACDSTQNTLGNLVYKTPRHFYVAAGTSAYLRSDATSGNVLFTRLNRIHVGSGATVQIGTGTTMYMDVLNIFQSS